jgi:hypothetical protein
MDEPLSPNIGTTPPLDTPGLSMLSGAIPGAENPLPMSGLSGKASFVRPFYMNTLLVKPYTNLSNSGTPIFSKTLNGSGGTIL